MNGFGARGERDLLIEAQVFGGGETYRHLVTLKTRGNDSGLRFESEIPANAGQPLNESPKTACPIAAHLTGAPVAVIESPGPVRFSRNRRHQENHAIGSDPVVAIAK